MKLRILMVSVAAVAAACSTGEPAATPPTTTSSRLDIPKVAKPLAVNGDSCGLLTDGNRLELGLPTASQDNTACNLHDGLADAKPLVFLRIQAMTDRGLPNIYAQCGTSASARCETWTIDAIDGYPLLRANSDTERRYGSCKQFLGISDQASILINDVKTGQAAAPDCARSDRVAAMVLANLASR